MKERENKTTKKEKETKENKQPKQPFLKNSGKSGLFFDVIFKCGGCGMGTTIWIMHDSYYPTTSIIMKPSTHLSPQHY